MKKTIAIATISISAITFAGLVDERAPDIFQDSEIMVNEAIQFGGLDDSAPFMYDAEEIISVKKWDYETFYQEGVDWTFDKTTHTIKLTPNTSISYYTEAQWYPETGTFSCILPGKKYVLFGEGATMHTNAVWVTYRHSDKWTGVKPKDETATFAPFLEELKSSAEGGNLVFYGDSITAGGNASATLNMKPKLPRWADQIFTAIQRYTGNKHIKYVNTASGGKGSTWGLQNIKALVTDYNPKFVLLAWGMNDGFATSTYKDNITKMVEAIYAVNPTAAIILVSPMTPNAEAKGFDAKAALFPEYETALQEIVDEQRAKGFARIGLANVNSVHNSILTRKRFRDLSGNNINHCNDFGVRMYRDVVLNSMGVVEISSVEPKRGKHGTTAWFNGGVAEGWPNATSKMGGNWTNISGSTYAEGELTVSNANFTAEKSVTLEYNNIIFDSTMKFSAYTETPAVPSGAKAGIVAVWEGSATNYYGISKSMSGANIWTRLVDSNAKIDEDVAVKVTVARRDGVDYVQYKADDYTSEWLPISTINTLSQAEYLGKGKVASLSAETEMVRMGMVLIYK